MARTLSLLSLAAALLFSAGAVSKTKISVGKMTVDGLEVHNLKCTLNKGGLFATAAVVGALAKKKKALDACHPAGAAFAVEIGWSKGTTAKVTRGSVKRGAACVAKALKRTKGPAGQCTAVILVGKSGPARKAAKGL